MAVYYDKEGGIAVGPITREEILDDILYHPRAKIERRKTCTPSLLASSQPFSEMMSNSNQLLNFNETVTISSDEETSIADEFKIYGKSNAVGCSILLDSSNDNDISAEVENLSLNGLDIKDRLPTPANIDEDTFDDSLSEGESRSDADIKEIKDNKEYNSHKSPIFEELVNEDDVHISCSTKEQVDLKSFCESDNEVYQQMLLLSPSDSRALVSRNGSSDGAVVDCESHEDIHETIDKTADNRHDFNDTISEMEKLLNEGLNYTMQSDIRDDTKLQKLPITNDYPHVSPNITPQIVSTPKRSLLNTPATKISASSAVHKATPSPASTRVDGGATKKPSAKKRTRIPVPPAFTDKPAVTPTNRFKCSPMVSVPTPGSSKNRFKDIQSPISIYIKNSATTPLYTTKFTPAKPSSADNQKSSRQISRKANKENSLVIPEVIYKPAKRAIVTNKKEIKLPNKIESLLPQKPKVIKHEARFGGTRNAPQTMIRQKLAEADLTIDSNATLDTTEDISLHCTGRAYITKNYYK